MPEPLIFLILMILIPLALMGWLVMRDHASRLEALSLTLFTALLVVFLFHWGQYPYVGSYYLRYALVILMVGTGVRVFRRASKRPWHVKPTWRQGLLLVLFGVGSLLLIPLVVKAFQAHHVDEPSVDMEFPLQGGTYYISTGGSNGVLNLHYKPQTPGQMFAIDNKKTKKFLTDGGDILERVFFATRPLDRSLMFG